MTRHTVRHLKAIVGGNIREAREAKGWTQRELSIALGVESMSVSRWERGRVLPDPALTLPRIAEALDTSPSWLLIDHEEDAA